MNPKHPISALMLITSLLFCCAYATADNNDDLQQIVTDDPHAVALTFTNDDAHPWTYTGSAIKSAVLGKNETSQLTITFTSNRRTEVQFSWQAGSTLYNNTFSYSSQYWLDGSWVATRSTGSETRRFFLEPGTHVICFKDSTDRSSSSNYTQLNSIRVRELMPLELTVLAEGSKSLTFANHDAYPWTVEDGYIQNGNHGVSGATSSFSTTFTIDKPALFTFERQITNNTNGYTYHRLRVSGLTGGYSESWDLQSSWSKSTYVLAEGTYTVVFYDSLWTTTGFYSRIRNISLTDDWAEVELAYAGTLGSEVLNIFETLYEVEMLKVKGNLNSTDWSALAQMTSIKGLDLSEASFDELPEKAFNKLTQLSYVTLPEGLTTINPYAFQKTKVMQVRLPSTVQTISNHSFYQLETLSEIIFPENTQLTTIGERAFYDCKSLRNIFMPNTVTSVGTYAFYNCSAMDSIILSDALTTLPTNMCYECTNLSYIQLPKNINTISGSCFNSKSKANTRLRSIRFPESLRTIEGSAFYNYANLDSIILPLQLTSLGSEAFCACTGTKYIQLPSYISGYNATFKTCSSLEKIVCPSATPPTITSDPFSGGRAKSDITLEVPSFATSAYKLDSYWYAFGSIVAGDDPDYWKISGDLVLSDKVRMQGSPTVVITTSGRLTVNGSQASNMSLLEFNCSSSSTSALLSSNANLSADSVMAYYYITDADKWFFVTPPYDVNLSAISHQGGKQFIFRYYDAERRAANGTGSSWQNITEPTLKRGQGYILQSNGTGWLNLNDNLHNGQQIFASDDVALQLATHAADKPANENWNFIGNPYPCYFDIWYLDFITPITVWTGSTYKAYSIADDDYALRPMQAFFVQKPSTVDQIVFRKQGRQTTKEISHAAASARQAAQSERRIINLSIAGDDANMLDETRVVINAAASLDYEMTCDAAKFMSIEPDVPQIYSLGTDGQRMSINERPLGDGVIALGCYAGYAGEYTISCSDDDEVVLIDKQTDTAHDFIKGAYTFTAEQSGDILDRFYLHIRQQHNQPTAISDNTAQLLIRPFAGGVAVDCTATDAFVYALDGRLMMHSPAGHGWARVFLPAGIYIIQAAGQTVKQVIE